VSAYNDGGEGPASAQACATTEGSASEITINLPGGVPLSLRRISGGTFTMGSPADEADRGADEDLHEVTLTHDYFIGVTEVTQAQWQALMGSNPSNFRTCGDDCPVEKVSWNMVAGADGFIERLNQHLTDTGQPGAGLFRLPTEAEWERAARAGTSTRFSHGDASSCDPECVICTDHDPYMWWCGNADGASHPVGSKEPNDFGLFDMHGNVWEWVQDVYQEHLGTAPQTDPDGPAPPGDRVMRGGSWYWHASSCRSARRHTASTTVTNYTYGFRLARSS
jgi:formylglycine-generating enzyme required for sulfatase activity